MRLSLGGCKLAALKSPQFFLSYAGEDAFEATLLKEAIESLLQDTGVRVWAFGRDQAGDQRSVGKSLKERVRESAVVILLLSRFTLEAGANQWMELAYADAFDIPTFILLHHLTFDELKRAEPGAPSLVLEGQCTVASEWHSLETGLRECCLKKMSEHRSSKGRRQETSRKGPAR
ncbi:hypothetical protein SBA4_6910009 [Candidatus Sulfopaludibacter sp. SbA4]|nr:hypothetical protein SBA4_6910009 [Candidatus Sulfopaludibacter sp. SbA4]